MNKSETVARRETDGLHVAVLMVLASAIGYGGYQFYSTQKQVIESGLHRQLVEIAAAKVSQVSVWRQERMGDAALAAVEARLMPDVQQVLHSRGTPEARRRTLEWMEALRSNYRYANIVLLNSDGQSLLTTGERLGTEDLYAEMVRESARAPNGWAFREYHSDPRVVRPHFVLGVRLRTDQGETSGVMLMGIDPQVTVYPSIMKWPTDSRTGEVFLVRRDGDRVLILSDLRRGPEAAMQLEGLGTKTLSPAVRAVVSQGIARGVDKSGVEVIATALRVPGDGKDWFVVSQIHAEEAYQPVRDLRMMVLLVSVLLFLACAAGVGLIWRHQVSMSYQQRYESEQERRALLGHYDYLTRNANDAILLLDESGAIRAANDRATEFFGYSKEELVQLNIRQLKTSQTMAEFDKAWEKLHREGSLLYETMNRRKDGREMATEVSVRVIDVDGHKYSQSIVRDITDRKQAERQIRRLNRLYAVLSRSGRAMVKARTEGELLDAVCGIASESGGFALAVITRLDPDTHQLIPVAAAGDSRDYLEGVEMSAADVPVGRGPAGTSVRELRPVICNDIPTDPAMTPWREMAARYNLRSSISLPLIRAGGVIGHLGLYATDSGFFDEEEAALAGEIAESVSHALDTLSQDQQRRRAEEELQVSRERLELVLDASDEGYWDWNLLSTEAHQSPRYETLLGYKPGELEPGYLPWRGMVHPEDLQATDQKFHEFIQNGTSSFSCEYRMRRKSGDYVWVICRGKVVERDQTGRPIRVVGTIGDITERKQLEAQFLQAQKLESVGRLAGGVAHDFNNLLTVINGYSSLLMKRLREGDPHRQQIQQILQAGEQAANLTQQLLVFSRKQIVEPQALRLNVEVSQAQKMLQRIVGEDIELTIDLRAKPDGVMADRGQIHQVLMNLVVNARDAMPNGGRIRLATENHDLRPEETMEGSGETPGSYVVLTVSDNGLGMDEKTRLRIFEPFFTTKEVGKGTGLGLATVYGIVRQSGGFIRLESEPGEGATFRICLPLVAANSVEGKAAVPCETAGTERILLVEDQEQVRTLAAESLRMYGYSVVTAANAEEALAQARRIREPIDLLLADVVMPGISGTVLAKKILEFRTETRVLFMSGYTEEALGRNGVIEAGTKYLQKPFTPDSLAARVRQVLDIEIL